MISSLVYVNVAPRRKQSELGHPKLLTSSGPSLDHYHSSTLASARSARVVADVSSARSVSASARSASRADCVARNDSFARSCASLHNVARAAQFASRIASPRYKDIAQEDASNPGNATA